MTEISAWLARHGLQQYSATFESNDIELRLLPSLTEQDFRELGVLSIGHRKKLQQAIAQLEQHGANESTQPLLDPVSRTAERRQLTVMFVDLVGSTNLSRQLDPEDFGEVLKHYRQICSQITSRYGGFLAQFLGDGIMIYFGYPVAHENEVERALHAGIEMLAAVENMEPVLHEQLQIRIGVATGTAVVGNAFGVDPNQEFPVLGDIPNLAARLQGVAEPGAMIASEETRALSAYKFNFKPRSPELLKGFSEPVSFWEVVSAIPQYDIDSVEGREGLVGVVGRETEIECLNECWQQACSGAPVVVNLTGEAGIGKSALTRMMYQTAQNQDHKTISLYCSSLHENSAYHPVINLLERTANFSIEDTTDQQRQKLKLFLNSTEQGDIAIFELLTELMGIAPSESLNSLHMTPALQKEKTQDALARILLSFARSSAVLLIVEDLHWVDPSTLEVIERAIEFSNRSAIMLLATYRPEFIPPWQNRKGVVQLELERLDTDSISRLILKLSEGSDLPVSVVEQIIERTDGIPLYVEELTRTTLDSSATKEVSSKGHQQNISVIPEVPSSLQDSLMVRLDRLAPFKEIAQLAAVVGRQFSLKLLAAVSSATEQTIHAAVEQFNQTGLVFSTGVPPDVSYIFKHALVHEAAYNSTLKSQRQRWHAEIAQVLEDFDGALGINPTILLAHHYQSAGNLEKSVQYWHLAGRKAISQSANLEANGHLRKGLDIVRSLPYSPDNVSLELELLIDLGDALTASAGYAAAETGQVYERAHQLAQAYPDAAEIFPAIYGLWNYYLVGAKTRQSLDYAERFHRLASQRQDTGKLVVANCMLGQNMAMLGKFIPARSHFSHVSATEAFEGENLLADIYGEDPRATSDSFDAWMLWHLGYPDQAEQCSDRAVERASTRQHGNSTALALTFDGILHILLRNPERARARADEVLALAAEQRLPYWNAEATIIKGWTKVILEDPLQGLVEMKQGLEAWRDTGASEHFVPGHTTFLAEGYLQAEQPAEGIAAIDQALNIIERTAESWYEAELHRHRAVLMMLLPEAPREPILASLEKAQSVALEQESLSIQLRIACNRYQYCKGGAGAEKAYQQLRAIYEKFTEGFTTVDLQHAHTLLAPDQ